VLHTSHGFKLPPPPILLPVQGRFSPTVSLPALCECLKKAALDPRVAGVVVKIDPLSCGWSKLQVGPGRGAAPLAAATCGAVQLCTSSRQASHCPPPPKKNPHARALQELRRHVEYFRASGKFSVAYLERFEPNRAGCCCDACASRGVHCEAAGLRRPLRSLVVFWMPTPSQHCSFSG
jgi:hypothetical protein